MRTSAATSFSAPALCLALVLLLASCAGQKTKPLEPALPPAPPVPEHIASTASEDNYTYMVASWYGPKFNGRPTASGEIFNMDALTAAHKDLPFGTRLLVTNVSNNKSVTVTINDRGPFIEGRDLDLSRAAAKEIKLIKAGTGKVKVKTLKGSTGYVRPVTFDPSGPSPFTVQAGSFKLKENAQKMRDTLNINHQSAAKGAAYIKKITINNTVHYRVRVGRFERREEARRMAEALSAEGYETRVTRYLTDI